MPSAVTRQRIHRAVLSALLAIGLAGPAGAAPCSNGGAERTVFGKWQTVPTSVRDISGAKTHVERRAPTGIRYFRVLMKLQEPGGERWQLVIRDAEQHVLEVLGPEDFANREVVLSRRHDTTFLVFDLETADTNFPVIRLRQEVLMPEAVDGISYYSRKVEGIDDWKPLFDPTVPFMRRHWGDNVAFVMVGIHEGSAPATCSGIVLPPGYLLTNWHCGPAFNGQNEEIPGAFWSQPICERTQMDLSWDDDQVSREFGCERVLATSQDLDYALLRIRPLEGSASIGPVAIAASTDTPTVSMVHHPAAAKKVISLNCGIVDRQLPSWLGHVAGATLTHRCDSEGGSSGAPMFDQQGNLVALHHLGFEIDPATGQCDKKNKAIWMKFILEDIERKLSTTEAPNLQQGDVDLLKRLVRN
jgi:hypothetical protein